MALELAALLVLGLMCGSELNVLVFLHPMLNRRPPEVHIPLRAAFARLFGRVMPFWMAGSALLNLLVLWPFSDHDHAAWQLAAGALACQVGAIVFSLVGPVPINKRIARWTPESVPNDWKAQERRWDVYHAWRTNLLIVAFILLCWSAVSR